MTPFNAAELPRDAVLDADQLIGRTPRRYLAAGAPIRRGDVQILRQVQVPVARPRCRPRRDADRRPT